MGQLTNYLEGKILDHALKTASYSPPSTLYLALFSATPGPTGGGTECVYTNYARQAITFGTISSGRVISQNAQVNFPQCGTTGDTAAYWGIFDAATSGNLLCYGALAASKSIVNGNTPTIASGQVTISINSGAMFTSFVITVLNWVFAGGSFSQPTNVNVGLSTTTPTDAGGNITEPSNGYSREAFNTWHASTVTGSAMIAKNNGTITMPTPTGSWGTITYGFLAMDSALAFYGALGQSQSPGSGDTVEWLDSQFTVQLQ